MIYGTRKSLGVSHLEVLRVRSEPCPVASSMRFLKHKAYLNHEVRSVTSTKIKFLKIVHNQLENRMTVMEGEHVYRKKKRDKQRSRSQFNNLISWKGFISENQKQDTNGAADRIN